MKKLIIVSLLVLLSASLVFAEYATVTSLGGSGDYKVAYTQTIKKGWNLLPTEVGAWGFSSDTSEATFQGLKALYIYLPLNQKYISVLGGFKGNDQTLLENNKPYLQSGAGWYYFSKDVAITYTVENGGGMPQLYRGWNLLSVSPSMSTLNPDVKASSHFPLGNCKVASFFMWNPEAQNWVNWKELGANVDKALDELSDPDGVGAGIAIKVKDTCQLGTTATNTNVGAPPGIPE